MIHLIEFVHLMNKQALMPSLLNFGQLKSSNLTDSTLKIFLTYISSLIQRSSRLASNLLRSIERVLAVNAVLSHSEKKRAIFDHSEKKRVIFLPDRYELSSLNLEVGILSTFEVQSVERLVARSMSVEIMAEGSRLSSWNRAESVDEAVHGRSLDYDGEVTKR